MSAGKEPNLQGAGSSVALAGTGEGEPACPKNVAAIKNIDLRMERSPIIYRFPTWLPLTVMTVRWRKVTVSSLLARRDLQMDVRHDVGA